VALAVALALSAPSSSAAQLLGAPPPAPGEEDAGDEDGESEDPAPPAPPSGSPAAAGPPVAAVRVEGNRRIEESVIRPVLRTRPGQPLDRAVLREDVRGLWAQKFFSDIKVDVSPGPGGPVVTFLLTEKPIVRETRLTGATEIDEEDLRKEIEVKPFTILDPEQVRSSARKLQAKYADKGFFLAEVEPKVLPAPGGQNQVDVQFDVVERAKVEVRRVAIQGNSALTDEEIKGVLGTQESSFLSFLTQQGTYKEEVFQRDLLVIQSLYYNKGYINVRVGQPAVTLSPDKRWISVTIPVEEGEAYDYGELEVGGELLGDDAVARGLLTVRTGERFSSQELQRTMMALQDHFRDRGYAYVQVTPQTAVDVENKRVAIRFMVNPGPLVEIERIELVGNTKTRDRVIRRELRIAEGDTYSGNGIRASKARVTALGYFEAVDITSRQGSRPDSMVLEVSVKEKATGTFQVGLGFSNQEPILLNANISQNNALGFGTSIALMVQLSRLRQIYSLSYTDPYFLDTPWTLAFDLYNTLQYFPPTFDRRAFGGTLTGGYEVFENFRFFGTYTLQQVEVVPTSSQVVVLANRFRGGLTSSLKGSFNYDLRDNRLFPTRGILLSGSAELAPTWLGSQNEFLRTTGIFRGYYSLPFLQGIVAKMNLTFGLISSPAANPVPVSELFFEGGINSLRGYNFRTVAPAVLAGTAPGAPLQSILVGGNKELIGNFELEFPLLQEAGLRGVVFLDIGNVYSETQNFFDPTAPGRLGLLWSAGLGARWFTPLGPLRFELGFPLTPRPGDQQYRFEFTIGNFF
jgi:outer membrane protein insertion porin family